MFQRNVPAEWLLAFVDPLRLLARYNGGMALSGVSGGAAYAATEAWWDALADAMARQSEGEGEISPAQDPHVIGYIDVIPDGVCAANDALAVINWINSHPPGGEGEGAPASAPPGPGGGNSGGEGEGAVQVQIPQNAADYYAQNLIHFANIPDVVPDIDALPRAAGPTQARSASEGLGGLQLFGDLSSSSARTVLTSLSSSTLLLKSNSSSQPISNPATTRKSSSDLLDDLASKLEQTLDDIAADISQADNGNDGAQL